MEIVKDKTKQSHGMTHSEMEELHLKQIQGEVEFVDANNAGDNIKDEHFAAQYSDHKIPAHEKHIYHVAVEARMFNQATGEKISNATVKKFNKETFAFMKKQEAFKGQTVHILHNPELEGLKGKEKAAAKVENLGGTTPPTETPEEKAKREKAEAKALREGLEAMTVPLLREQYADVTGGEQPPSAMRKEELIEEIIAIKKSK